MSDRAQEKVYVKHELPWTNLSWAGQRAARSDSSNKVVNFSISLVPDFRSGCLPGVLQQIRNNSDDDNTALDEMVCTAVIGWMLCCAVAYLWVLGLVGLSNWPKMYALPPSMFCAMLTAFATAPFMPFSAAVRTTLETKDNQLNNVAQFSFETTSCWWWILHFGMSRWSARTNRQRNEGRLYCNNSFFEASIFTLAPNAFNSTLLSRLIDAGIVRMSS